MSRHSLTNCLQIYWYHGQQEEENACRCRSAAMSTRISLQQERQAEQWCWLGRRVAELENLNVEALPELMAFLGALEWWRIRMCYLYSVHQNVICDFRRTWVEATWEPQNERREDRKMVELAWGHTAILRWSWNSSVLAFPSDFSLLVVPLLHDASFLVCYALILRMGEAHFISRSFFGL